MGGMAKDKGDPPKSLAKLKDPREHGVVAAFARKIERKVSVGRRKK